MSLRVQENPFRETEWDYRLDKMLDDLKTTVSTDGDRSSRRDQSLVSSFRSTSRSESRSSNRGVEDLGLMKHHHKEYTSPDKSTKVVTDEYEYDSGDPNKNFQKKVKKSTYSSYKVSGGLSNDMDDLHHGPHPAIMANAADTEGADSDPPNQPSETSKLNKNIQELDHMLQDMDHQDGEKETQKSYTEKNTQIIKKKTDITSENVHCDQGTTAPPDHGQKFSYDADMDVIDDKSGGEVKRIVWRNRFEKTYETQDSSTPSMSVEADARMRSRKPILSDATTTLASFNPQAPPTSPGKPWAEPIPMPTPPQVSPGEPGVAYVYTYGQDGGSKVQHLPPLNYVSGVPPAEGRSPTPGGSQPVIYHYSYHYNILPGQKLPDGIPIPPGSDSQPALQVVSPPQQQPPAQVVSQTGSHSYKSHESHYHPSSTHFKDNTSVQHIHHYHDSPSVPSKISDIPRKPDPKSPESNISISINKRTTHTTHTKEYPVGGPASTSTPYHTRGRSHSPSPDRYPRGPSSIHTSNAMYTTTSYGSDSLERLKRPPSESLPFPDTSPIKNPEDGSIPRKVDELMHSFDSGDGRIHHTTTYMNGPNQPEREPLVTPTKREEDIDLTVAESEKIELNKTKNVSGAPVYYPPGHQQLFSDSMHTMTLKEKKRRGMAKWRAEKMEKEKASHSESKGGMAMVPVCLPLCCGAACTIM